jgi:hypothetical protein
VWLPDAVWLAVGAASGVLAAVVAASAWAPRVRAMPGRGLAAAAVVGVAAVLAVAADGYVARHAQTHGTLDWPVSQWFAERSSFRTGHETIVALPIAMAPLAGDRLQHRVELMPPDLSCSRLVSTARRGWVVVGATPVGPEYRELFPSQSRAVIHAASCLRHERPAFVSVNGWAVFGPAR